MSNYCCDCKHHHPKSIRHGIKHCPFYQKKVTFTRKIKHLFWLIKYYFKEN